MVFLNGPSLASFYFRLFKQTLQLLQQINVKNGPSSILCWDSNPWRDRLYIKTSIKIKANLILEHESPPITTRPGLRPRETNVTTTMFCPIDGQNLPEDRGRWGKAVYGLTLRLFAVKKSTSLHLLGIKKINAVIYKPVNYVNKFR